MLQNPFTLVEMVEVHLCKVKVCLMDISVHGGNKVDPIKKASSYMVEFSKSNSFMASIASYEALNGLYEDIQRALRNVTSNSVSRMVFDAALNVEEFMDKTNGKNAKERRKKALVLMHPDKFSSADFSSIEKKLAGEVFKQINAI